MSKYPDFNTPYEAGYDAAENGASIRNCHFGFFSTPERTKEWEKGNADAKKEPTPMTIPPTLERAPEWPTCHFRAMVLEEGDNGNGGCDVFYECTVCGHTKPHNVQWRVS